MDLTTIKDSDLCGCDDTALYHGWNDRNGPSGPCRINNCGCPGFLHKAEWEAQRATLQREAPALETFANGAHRHKPEGEPTRYDLISPQGLRAWAEACAEGADRYGEKSYEQTDVPLPQGNLIGHAIGHLYAYLAGDMSTPNHLGHALWNIGLAVENDRRSGTSRSHIDQALQLPRRTLTARIEWARGQEA